ncbi:FAD:protein FMN transferase [Hoeflea prorocentri]|uniref:FAD:protein FMN transferase n=1 Tax=Hoeflea prorocentri TaxID=1922333 RepID=A0A9X3UGQ0_9HYPH|nr:FAD:protein FMN transferase [Hoeflea prorocentri]MCY6380180.1 FAD:protein FMN transferase [Hoeflea prorocentri]MDA5397980.1 FAD:protein FMN transferase [Hoeflea prorocentri]
MMPRLQRRRFLALTAAAVALPRSALASAPVANWRGTALGAPASMSLAGVEPSAASGVFAAVEAEVSRLENIFSLYRPHSALSRLNKDGRLSDAPAEMIELLSLCDALHAATQGAFDPTIQPLWALYAQTSANNTAPTEKQIIRVLEQTGWTGLERRGASLSFASRDMALTLNGIAQGYVTDKIAALLRRHGLTDIAINMGETAALGKAPRGGPWRAGIVDPEGRVQSRIPLNDRALATSAPLGTVLDATGSIGHIIDPRTGRPGGQWSLVSVSAANAALADGLSTAFCLMTREQIDATLAAMPNVSLEILI